MHGSSVEAGVKYSESPFVLHAPATAGLTCGRGEPGAGVPDSLTHSGVVPSRRIRSGSAVRVVCASGATGVAALAWWEPSRPLDAVIATGQRDDRHDGDDRCRQQRARGPGALCVEPPKNPSHLDARSFVRG